MRRFRLVRREDVSGVSGVGVVVLGVRFPSGKCVLEWQRPLSSIAVYDDVQAVMAVHGHSGKTVLEWLDTPFGAAAEPSTLIDSRRPVLDADTLPDGPDD